MNSPNNIISQNNEVKGKYRVQPNLIYAFVILIAYMSVFSTIWILNDVDYKTIGKTIESTKMHYALPTILSSLVIAILISIFGWWRIVLFDVQKSGPKWLWFGLITMLILAIFNFSAVNFYSISSELLLYSLLGGIGVGFGEEVIVRGSMLVGLRSKNLSENNLLLYSSLIFAAIHIPNMFFGSPIFTVLIQLCLAFIVGSLLYIARRISGTLLIPMFLHGFWDSSIFLPGAVGGKANPIIFIIYPISIICIIGYLRYNRIKKIHA